jgi:protein-tyrosine sulfotransferase
MFIGGVPRSGTTLMRAMLDAHPSVRCGEETRIVPRMVAMRFELQAQSDREKERLEQAGVTQDVIDSAVGAFILDIIVHHGAMAPYLCNKDPLMLSYMPFLKSIFPQSRFILMIRDGRATVHSIISRHITISGFNLSSYRDCLIRWNSIIEKMYNQCTQVNSSITDYIRLYVYLYKLFLRSDRILA